MAVPNSGPSTGRDGGGSKRGRWKGISPPLLLARSFHGFYPNQVDLLPDGERSTSVASLEGIPLVGSSVESIPLFTEAINQRPVA